MPNGDGAGAANTFSATFPVTSQLTKPRSKMLLQYCSQNLNHKKVCKTHIHTAAGKV